MFARASIITKDKFVHADAVKLAITVERDVIRVKILISLNLWA